MTHDLSQHHQPVGRLFDFPPAAKDRARFRLSDAQRAFFQENGFVNAGRVLSDRQVDALCEELETFFTPDHAGRELWHEYHSNESADPSRVLFHALGAWRISPGFHDLLWHPAVVVPAGQLLGGSVRFWHDQLFCKPARHGGVVAWHQDYSYWTRTEPLAHLSCWIALDDSNRHNGCVRYVPGSHRWDLLPITGLAGDVDAIRRVLTDRQWEQLHAPVDMEMPRGHCSFHHALTVHGSLENHSDQPRRATVINLFADGVRSASDEPPQPDIPVIPRGEIMQGRFFPLLYDADSRDAAGDP